MLSPLGRRVLRGFERKRRLSFKADRSPAEAQAWADEVRLLVRRRLDDWHSVSAKCAFERQVDGLSTSSLVFSTDGEPRFRATLLEPTAPAPKRYVLVLPGRNAVHSQLIGLEPPDFPQRNVSERLTRAGYATLTIDYGITTGPKSDPQELDETLLLAQALALQGRSLLGCLASDACAALRWLEARAISESGRVGVLGQSLGGHIALHAALGYDRRLPLIVSSCASSYKQLFWRDFLPRGGHALPDILDYVDLPDLLAAYAPSFLQIQHGQDDSICPIAEAVAATAVASAAYRTYGSDDKLDVAFLPMGHAVDADRAAYFFKNAFDNTDAAARPLIPAAHIHFDAAARRKALDLIDRSLATGTLTLGPTGERFERAVASVTGSPGAVAVSSGTAAIEVALRALGVAGRVVLVPANTFIATATAALFAGAKIRFVDIEADGLGLDPNAVARELERNNDIAAVIAVHIGGIISPRIADVAALCDRYGATLVEDAAHALGSTLNGTPAGSLGRLSAFSFYPTKVVTSAEGGVLCGRSADDLATARILRDHGKSDFLVNLHDKIGNNWRMSEIHAAIGLTHVGGLSRIISQRRAAAAYYDLHLSDIPGLEVLREPPGVYSNYYKYIVLLEPSLDRTALKRTLRQNYGIALSGEVYDTLCCLQPALAQNANPREFPTAYRFSQNHICLPLFPDITQEQQDRVVSALRSEAAGKMRVAASNISSLEHNDA